MIYTEKHNKKCVVDFLQATVKFNKGGDDTFSFVFAGNPTQTKKFIDYMRVTISRFRAKARAEGRKFSSFKVFTESIEEQADGNCLVVLRRGHSAYTETKDALTKQIEDLGSLL